MAKTLKKVDVVTVGVGFLGGLVLAECAKAGLSGVGLERGERRGLEDFQEMHDEWRYAVNYALMQDLSRETITFRNTEAMRALPMRRLGSFLLGDGLGGAGTHWNGMNFRFSPYDFRIKTNGTARTSSGRTTSCRTTRFPTRRWSRTTPPSSWPSAFPANPDPSTANAPNPTPCRR